MAPFYPYKTRRKYAESEGINADHSWVVRCQAFGKGASDVSPYLIANEWIASNIAQFLRLPIPPFSLQRKKTRSTVMFSSYSFEGDSKPANSDPAVLYKKFPEICAGVVVFDILVANFDRHHRNIKVDNAANPTTLYIIDHERSLFHLYPGRGIKQLKAVANRLGITDGTDSRNEWHCLIELLESADDISTWIGKVASLPNWFIETICNDVWKVSITAAERNAVIEWLKGRRDSLGPLILSHKDRFTSIDPKSWPMFL
jgi:hypothetical protein